MDLFLSGKTALITGGSAGIGFACADRLASEGVHVAIAARDRDRLANAAQALHATAEALRAGVPRVLAVAADLSLAEDVERTVRDTLEAFGHIDILINCAGSAVGGQFLELPDSAYLNAWTLKLLGYIRMTRAVVPGMIARRDGRIVNIVGGAARFPAATFLTGSTANAALINFTRGLSKDLAPHNVRINAISPGTTQTERTERGIAAEVAAGKSDEAVREERLRRIPLHRVTQPDEIASMAALIVSDRMASMTGAEVLVDGGAMPAI
jgi:3-oxoacyl-[acyl-carrier protein] reductase/bacilysin biosynthesis oxidoreductase BacG